MLPAMGFEWAYQNGTPPWEIGRAQSAIVGLAEQGAISGSVLDLGCGTGDNVLYLASLGLDVTGIDASPTAIGRAKAKAAERGIDATFIEGNALDLAGLRRSFDVVVDCGLFHIFSDAERVRYEGGLSQIVRPGGRYFLLCFSDRQPGTSGPRRVTQAEIRGTFFADWRVDSVVPEHFSTLGGAPGSGADKAEAWLASLTRIS
jgi:cyclopropane fatty-acyl-phospholipid synthase-like methyltransferase